MQGSSFSSSFMSHGGRLDEAALRFPDAPLPWIDLSTGISPRPYPIAEADGADHRALPSRTALARLEEAAAHAFGMAQGAVAALPGSEVGLRLLATVGVPGPVRFVSPGYGTYAEIFPRSEPVRADGLRAAAGTVLLANPNNPDGRLLPPGHVLDLARSLGADGGWLVVDEAFADAVDGSSVLPLLQAGDRVLVLRSFGKFYGLAGVRLGFACGHPGMVERVRERLGEWPVSAAAIRLGTAAYADTAWREAMLSDLAQRADALDAVLRRHGLMPTGACPLFRLVEAPHAPALFERLGRAGILTRPFSYAPTWLRVGLPPDEDALGRLDRALGHG